MPPLTNKTKEPNQSTIVRLCTLVGTLEVCMTIVYAND